MAEHNDPPSSDSLPDLPDLPALGAAPSRPGSGASESGNALPAVHGLTPPRLPTGGAAAVDVQFSAPDRDLSVALSIPEGPPDPPQPMPAVPPPGQPVDSEPAAGGGQPRLTAGRMFGGYQLEAKIGQGGMGEVYKARQVSLDRVVAIKILSKALYDNEEFIKRFEREAKAIARITHPNIVGVYDFGQADGLRFMVNEFVDGNSLAKLISDRLLLPAAEFVPLMVQCLAGLGYVGSQGIVHRDIKPDNILITKDGIAKIADFGLAKDVSRKDDHTDLTAVGLAMGTPAYMSPEQCMGQKLDVRSDLYAFGVTAWFALTGQKPFTGNSSFEVMTKQREYMPPPPHEVVPGIPPALSPVILRMLAKKAEDRFPDAESCRLAWIDVGVQLGVLGRAELDARPRASSEMPALVPLPPAPTSASAPPLPAPQAEAPAMPPPAEAPRPSPVARVGTESVRSHERPSPERPSSERAVRRVSDSTTCPMCGNLNRPEAAVCGRCGNVLRMAADAASLQQQEAEAQRLYEAKRFADAASLWARLADRETDKRSRSVLRSKEREARKQEHDHRIGELRARAAATVARGDLQAALTMLEQGRDLHRDSAASSASSSVTDVQLERDVAALRARLAWRRRARNIVLVLVIAVLAVVALVAVRQGWFRSPPAPAPAAAPAAAPPGATP
jgi:serine/threonine protein kinase